MSKITKARGERSHETVRRMVKGPDGKPVSVTVEVKKPMAPPAMTKFLMCRICRQPMRVSPGQIAFQHKRCKKLYGRNGRQKYVWDQNRAKSVIRHSETVKTTTTGSQERVNEHAGI